MDGDEGKRFLQDFLARLIQADETNRTLIETNTMLVRQIAKNAEVTTALTRNVAALAQRTEVLARKMDTLSRLLVEDGSNPPGDHPQTRGIPFGVVGEHLRDSAGRWVGRQIHDAFWPGDGSGR